MDKNFNESNAGIFGKFYSQSNLFNKIGKVAKKAKVKLVYAVLLLFYALKDNNISLKDKAIVIGALGYFICPVDAIPDILGPIGYTDDTSVALLAVQRIWANISDSTRLKARTRLKEWFGEINPKDLELF